MPLFGHKEPVQEPVVQEDVPSRRRSMFSSKTNHSTTPSTRSEGNTSSPHRHGTGLLHRDREDSSITAAREQVINAEAAERQADKALLTARAAVKEAREQVKRLEREAAEEYVLPFDEAWDGETWC
jgi:hypothetical protein